MKAIDYFEQFKPSDNSDLIPETLLSVSEVYSLLNALNEETLELIKIRHIKYDRALPALLDEQNAKWNAISRLFEKKYGKTPLAKDGFKRFWYRWHV